MQVWSEFGEAVPVENIKQILICPLWHNDRIGNGQPFLRNWCDMGIRVIYDLINEEGVFYSFEQLKAKYNIRGTFLDYQHVLNSISQVWKDQINMNCVFIVQTAYIYVSDYTRKPVFEVFNHVRLRPAFSAIDWPTATAPD